MTERGGNDDNPQQAEYLKHLYRGSELLLNDQIQEAREVLEAASRIDPDDPKCLSLLGLVYFRLDDYEPAEQIYELLVQRFPEEASLRVNLGLVYMKKGEADRARAEMLAAVEIDPGHQRAHGYLGLLHSERGEHEEARRCFEVAGQDVMVQQMDEAISAGKAPERFDSADITADALPPDPSPFGAPAEESTDAPPAPGSPPPVAPPPPATEPVPVEGIPVMTSDGQTLPVAAARRDEAATDAPEPGAPPPVEPVPEPGSPPPVGSAPAPGSPPPVAPVPAPGSPPPVVAAPAPGSPPPVEPMVAPGSPPPVAPVPEPGAPPPVEAAPAPAAIADAPASDPSPEGAAVPSAGSTPTDSTFAEELDAVIDEAVGPPEPWPDDGVAVDPPPAVAGAAEAGSASVAASATSQADEPVEATPIFSFATSGLIDLTSTQERMTAPARNLLIFPVLEDGFIRADALAGYVGELTFEPAHRRAKGQFIDEPMQDQRGQFLKAIGDGVLLCNAGDTSLTVLDLYDDFLYLRSEYLFAYESSLHWENGKLLGERGPIELIHIRGEGRLALWGGRELKRMRLVPESIAYVSEDALVGWMGRVIPQTRSAAADSAGSGVVPPMIRCEGEGVILVRPVGDAGDGTSTQG